MTRILLAAACCWAVLFSASADEWTQADTEALLQAVRNPPIRECWAILTGTVNHRAHGKDDLSLPIQLRARFAPDRSLMQLVFNQRERYLIGQNFADGIHGTSVIPEVSAGEKETALQDIGIRPSDITLSFLYWSFVGEQGEDSYKAQNCRILLFRHPTEKETARVWVSTKYRFPLLVKWYLDDAAEPYRQLEITDFKKVEDVWLVTRVKLGHTGWKTEVRFTDIKLEPIEPDKPIPDDLFLQE